MLERKQPPRLAKGKTSDKTGSTIQVPFFTIEQNVRQRKEEK